MSICRSCRSEVCFCEAICLSHKHHILKCQNTATWRLIQALERVPRVQEPRPNAGVSCPLCHVPGGMGKQIKITDEVFKRVEAVFPGTQVRTCGCGEYAGHIWKCEKRP